MYVCMRVTQAKDDKLSLMKNNPAYKHQYVIPEIHTLAPISDEKDSTLLGKKPAY